ncbi:uncharacterized protein METZ01_LOCUS195808, partial [marine metagenome]
VVPGTFLARAEEDTTLPGLQSNIVVEIRAQGDSLIWLGTGKGLSVQKDSLDKRNVTRTFQTSKNITAGETGQLLPEGGISAVGVAGKDTLLVSVATTIDEEIAGGGLALSINSRDPTTARWSYFDQPKDSSGDSTLSWGGVTLSALPVTVPQNNVTYDIAIGKRYYWTASWAGGLRRLNKSNVLNGWKRVPLPDDNRTDFLCGQQYDGYQLNPRDPPQGNHNHKAFSVMTYGDTVWVGTANGINRGILDDSGCLDWKNYSFPISSISGNWVIAIEKQEWKGRRTIWAVTRAADQAGEENGISFTQNDGETWQTVALLKGE